MKERRVDLTVAPGLPTSYTCLNIWRAATLVVLSKHVGLVRYMIEQSSAGEIGGHLHLGVLVRLSRVKYLTNEKAYICMLSV